MGEKVKGVCKFGFVVGLAPTIMSLFLWRRWHGEAVTDEEKGQRTTIRGKEKLGVGPISLLLPVLLIHRYRGPPSPKEKAKENDKLQFECLYVHGEYYV